MREILFRGKMKKDGTWCYGNLCAACGGKYIVSTSVFPLSIHGEVKPETIGQFTGLTDKNGVKIFEGDVVKTKKYGKVVEHSNVNDYDTFVVIFEPCTFRLINKTRGFNLTDDGCSKLEVIGNKFDNPELLKATGEDIGNAAQDTLLPAT